MLDGRIRGKRRIRAFDRQPIESMRDSGSTCSPVFIIGAPRSGTSILTWCLGQHPNILGIEESNWMAPFAVDLAVAFRRGSARGERSQIYSMGMERDRFMREIGDRVNKSILAQRETFEDRLHVQRENIIQKHTRHSRSLAINPILSIVG